MSATITVSSTGIQSPQTSEIKQAFKDVFTNAFGSNINLDDATPQGDIINDLSELKQLDNSALLYLLNQIDPDKAEGIFQDAIANLYFIKRLPATPSVVSCVVTGLAGTVLNGINTGNPALAQSISGDIFECLTTTTIPASGTATVQFQSQEKGEIACGQNTINKIYVAVSGWDAVNNPTSGVVGSNEESRSEFSKRIKQSLAKNATGSLSAVYSAIFDVDGVTDLFVWENDTDETITYRGIQLKPHSVYTCVNGGSGEDIAKAIYKSKSAGCDTNGTVQITYTDPITTVVYDYSIYRPTTQNIYVNVSLYNAVGPDIEVQMREAILNSFTGADGESVPISIGDSVYASKFFGVLNSFDADIVNIKVSNDGSTWVDYLEFNMNILPILDENNITIGV